MIVKAVWAGTHIERLELSTLGNNSGSIQHLSSIILGRQHHKTTVYVSICRSPCHKLLALFFVLTFAGVVLTTHYCTIDCPELTEFKKEFD